jgi:hypothetical protein
MAKDATTTKKQSTAPIDEAAIMKLAGEVQKKEAAGDVVGAMQAESVLDVACRKAGRGFGHITRAELIRRGRVAAMPAGKGKRKALEAMGVSSRAVREQLIDAGVTSDAELKELAEV